MPVTDNVINKIASLSEKLAKFNESAQDTSYQDWIDGITGSTGELQKLQNEITEVWLAMDAGDIGASAGFEFIDQLEARIKGLKTTVEKADIFGGVTDSIKESLAAVQDLSAQGSKDYAKLGIAIQLVTIAQKAQAIAAAATMATARTPVCARMTRSASNMAAATCATAAAAAYRR